MAKRLHPCPYRPEELDLSDGQCRACGKPVVDLAAGSREEATEFLAQRMAGCVRLARAPGGRMMFHQKALTGALTVAAALAAGAAPRLAAELPAGIVRGAAIELPELDEVSPNDAMAFPRMHEPPSPAEPIDEEMLQQLVTAFGGEAPDFRLLGYIADE